MENTEKGRGTKYFSRAELRGPGVSQPRWGALQVEEKWKCHGAMSASQPKCMESRKHTDVQDQFTDYGGGRAVFLLPAQNERERNAPGLLGGRAVF